MNDLPIGLFDSGMGGLTVMRELASLLPNEDLVYLGDTARLPYGNKSPEAIRRFSLDNASFLLEQKVKLVIISCHTACSHAFELVQQSLPIPVLGVTDPGYRALLASTKNNRVAVLGTQSTIGSGIYQTLLKLRRPDLEIFPIACPLFVPLVEEGLQNHPVAEQMAEHYLAFLRDEKVDAALLACTHYPLLRDCIQKALPEVELIEPARACALQAKELLTQCALLNREGARPLYRFFASDDPEKFRHLAKLFFPYPIPSVELLLR